MIQVRQLLNQIRHPVATNLGARSAGLVGLALTAIVVARVGGPALVGVLALLRVLPPLVGVVTTAGLNGSCIYFLAGPDRGRPDLRPTILAMAVLGGAAGSLVWALSSTLLGHLFFPNLSVGLVMLAGLRVLGYTFVAIARGSLQGAHDFKGANWVFLMEDWLILPLFIVLILARVEPLTAVVVGLLLSDLSICVIAWDWLARQGYFRHFQWPSLILAQRIASFGVRSEVGSIIQLLNLRLEVLIIGSLAGPAALGTYFVASRYAELLRLAPIALNFVLQPRYSAVGRSAARARALALAPRATLITVAGAVPLGLLAFIIPVIYGDLFQGAVLPARILLIGLALEGLSAVTMAYLFGTGRPGFNSFAMGVGLVVTVALALYLIPRYGAVGAALASAAAYVVTTCVLLACFIYATRRDRLEPQPDTEPPADPAATPGGRRAEEVSA